MKYRLIKYATILLLFCFSIPVDSPVAFAESGSDLKQQMLLAFENKVFDLLDSGMESLNELDGETDMKRLHYIVLSARQKFDETSRAFAKLMVPIALPGDIKASLVQIKVDLSTGFEALEASMNCFMQYMDNRSPLLFEQFIEQRDQGISHIDGALTSLSTVRMQLNPPKLKPNAWTVAKKHLYEIQSIDYFE